MKTRRTLLLLLVVGTGGVGAGLAACSGDSTTTDGGTDATTETGGNDSGKVDSGGTDGGGTDGGGTDGGGTDGGGTDGGTDGGGTDGGGTDAAPDGGTFACGSVTCDSTTQYCTKTLAGQDSGLPDAAKINDASVLDGGQIEIDQCLAYPTTCTADGGTPNCTCTQGNCGSCSQNGTDITVLCP